MSEIMVLPYFGGEEKVVGPDQAWRIRPRSWNRRLYPGWYRWVTQGRWAEAHESLEVYENFEVMDAVAALRPLRGYLLGDRGLLDNLDPRLELDRLPRIRFIPQELRKFTRIRAGLWYDQQHWVFMGEEPRSEWEDVAEVQLEDKHAPNSVLLTDPGCGATPQLKRAFRLEQEMWFEVLRRRAFEEEEARKAAAALAAAERERLLEEARKAALATFDGRVKESLSSMGAELLSIRDGFRKDEAVIRYKYHGERLECVVRKDTLGIIDSGICLTDHRTDEDYSQRLTLRALVGVVDEAIRTHKLVVYRGGR